VRILHVLGGLNRGGAETMIMNIYRTIDRSKIQFDFVVHTDLHCDYTDEILDLGGIIYSIPKYNGKNHFKYKKKWELFFQEHTEYEILHSHIRSTATIFLPIAKKHGLKTIVHSHNTSSGKGVSAIVKDIYQLPIRCIADYFFACSVSAGKWLFGRKIISSDRFHIVRNAIDAHAYAYSEDVRKNIRKELHISDSCFVVGHIGRFHEQKNHDFLIEIFNEIHKNHANSMLILVGDGSEKEKIVSKVKKMNLSDNVVFTGVRNDVPSLLSAMDAFVFPSYFEGLGIVAVEAQASGLHTICADTIPQEARITDLFEYLSLSDDSKKWASSVMKYTGGYERHNMCLAICNAGYDINCTTGWIQDFYLNLMTDKR